MARPLAVFRVKVTGGNPGIALACMDGGHSVRAVWVPKDASSNARATAEAVNA